MMLTPYTAIPPAIHTLRIRLQLARRVYISRNKYANKLEYNRQGWLLVATNIMATSEVATVVSTKQLENILVEPVISKPVPDHLTGTSKWLIE